VQATSTAATAKRKERVGRCAAARARRGEGGVSGRPARAAAQRTSAKARSPPPPVAVVGGARSGVAHFRCRASAPSFCCGAGQHWRPHRGAAAVEWLWGGRRHSSPPPPLRPAGRRQPQAAVRHGWQKDKLGVAGGRVKEGLLSGRGMGRHSVGVRGGGRAGRATWTDPGTVVSNFVSNSEHKT